VSSRRLVITGGPIYTMDPDPPRARAVYVDGERVVGVVAHDDGATVPADDSWSVSDLRGRALLPAFADCHVHLLYTGWHSHDPQLDGATTLSELLDLVKAAADSSRGEVVRGWNYDDSGFDRPLTGRDLDSISSTRPIFLSRIGNAASCVNSAAMRLFGISPSIEGVQRNPDGTPNGILLGDANHVALTRLYELMDGSERRAVFAAGARTANAAGVTTVHAIEGGTDRQLAGDPPSPNLILDELVSLELPITVIPFDNQVRSLAELDRIAGQGRRHVGGDIFVDGVLGAAYMPGVNRAALFEPYADGDPGSGHLVIPRNLLSRLIARCAERGLQLSVHAVGDRAIATFLDAVEDAASSGADAASLRLRIEHGILPTPHDIERAGRLGIIFSTQPAFELSAGGPGKRYERRLGPQRVRRTHPLRELWEAGVCVVGGSDAPVNPIAPLQGIRAAVQHPFPDHRLSLAQAVSMFTRNAAFAAFGEGDHGTISEGRLADFVVLSDDLLAIEPDRIELVRVVETWHRGAKVFDAREDLERGMDGGRG